MTHRFVCQSTEAVSKEQCVSRCLMMRKLPDVPIRWERGYEVVDCKVVDFKIVFKDASVMQKAEACVIIGKAN